MPETDQPERLANPERLRADAPLPELAGRFGELYSPRDNIYLPGREGRISLLYRAIDDLQTAVRRETDWRAYEDLNARIVSRIFCIARSVDNVSVSDGLEAKYPLAGCAYCQQLPCECQERRSEIVMQAGGSEQSQWSLGQWQEHLLMLYGAKNVERGITYVLLRLGSEYGELISLERSVSQMTITEIKREYALELADALAWTIAAANLLVVDLEQAVDQRYGQGCQTCYSFPCACGPYNFSQLRSLTG